MSLSPAQRLLISCLFWELPFISHADVQPPSSDCAGPGLLPARLPHQPRAPAPTRRPPRPCHLCPAPAPVPGALSQSLTSQGHGRDPNTGLGMRAPGLASGSPHAGPPNVGQPAQGSLPGPPRPVPRPGLCPLPNAGLPLAELERSLHGSVGAVGLSAPGGKGLCFSVTSPGITK